MLKKEFHQRMRRQIRNLPCVQKKTQYKWRKDLAALFLLLPPFLLSLFVFLLVHLPFQVSPLLRNASSQFPQHFMISFFANILLPNKLQSQTVSREKLYKQFFLHTNRKSQKRLTT